MRTKFATIFYCEGTPLKVKQGILLEKWNKYIFSNVKSKHKLNVCFWTKRKPEKPFQHFSILTL